MQTTDYVGMDKIVERIEMGATGIVTVRERRMLVLGPSYCTRKVLFPAALIACWLFAHGQHLAP